MGYNVTFLIIASSSSRRPLYWQCRIIKGTIVINMIQPITGMLHRLTIV
jgi:hypothetical protein